MAIPIRPKSLYVHLPFCRHICPYCDFPKLLLATGFANRYASALLAEDLATYPNEPFDTIFIGGGTPSAMPLDDLDRILAALVERHGKPAEFTLEANPEDVNPDLVNVLVSHGVNRVSMGVQTVNAKGLKALGRHHTAADAKKAIDLLRANGIDNVSVDFIYGLPGEGMAELDADLAAVKSWDLPHVSFYALQVEPNTAYAIRHVQAPSGDVLRAEYDRIVSRLESIGLYRYEVSNFAKPGYESKHNLCYWLANPYGAIGLGATSFVDGVRAIRTKSMGDYLAGHWGAHAHRENAKDLEFEYLMLHLRLRQGFSLRDFQSRFGIDFREAYRCKIASLGSALIVSGDTVRVRDDRIYTLDSLLVSLLDFDGLSD